MSDKVWKIYLSGEIHSDWREQIMNGCAEAGLPVEFAAPITEHDDSDDCGVVLPCWVKNQTSSGTTTRARC